MEGSFKLSLLFNNTPNTRSIIGFGNDLSYIFEEEDFSKTQGASSEEIPDVVAEINTDTMTNKKTGSNQSNKYEFGEVFEGFQKIHDCARSLFQKNGLVYLPEFETAISRQSAISSNKLSKKEIDMFVQGALIERYHSNSKTIRDLSESLKLEVVKLSAERKRLSSFNSDLVKEIQYLKESHHIQYKDTFDKLIEEMVNLKGEIIREIATSSKEQAVVMKGPTNLPSTVPTQEMMYKLLKIMAFCEADIFNEKMGPCFNAFFTKKEVEDLLNSPFDVEKLTKKRTEFRTFVGKQKK